MFESLSQTVAGSAIVPLEQTVQGVAQGPNKSCVAETVFKPSIFHFISPNSTN